MKVVMVSEEGKTELIRAAKNGLSQLPQYEKVAIKPDRTPKEREVMRQLVLELKDREKKGEQGLMIRNGKVIQKRQEPRAVEEEK